MRRPDIPKWKQTDGFYLMYLTAEDIKNSNTPGGLSLQATILLAHLRWMEDGANLLSDVEYGDWRGGRPSKKGARLLKIGKQHPDWFPCSIKQIAGCLGISQANQTRYFKELIEAGKVKVKMLGMPAGRWVLLADPTSTTNGGKE